MSRVTSLAALSFLLLFFGSATIGATPENEFAAVRLSDSGFIPRAFALDARSVFVVGQGESPNNSFPEATIVAFDAETRTVRWRFRREDPDLYDEFESVAADRHRVCAAGVRFIFGGLDSNLIVACFDPETGSPLWQKELFLPGISSTGATIRLTKKSVIVMMPVFVPWESGSRRMTSVVLSFSVEDGS